MQISLWWLLYWSQLVKKCTNTHVVWFLFHTCEVSKGSFPLSSFPLSSSCRAIFSCNTQEWQRIGKEHFICIHYKKTMLHFSVYVNSLSLNQNYIYCHCPSCIAHSRRLLYILKMNQPSLFNWHDVKENMHHANWHLFVKPALSQLKRKYLMTHHLASYYSESWTVILND